MIFPTGNAKAFVIFKLSFWQVVVNQAKKFGAAQVTYFHYSPRVQARARPHVSRPFQHGISMHPDWMVFSQFEP
jgi:hypothetical protein